MFNSLVPRKSLTLAVAVLTAALAVSHAHAQSTDAVFFSTVNTVGGDLPTENNPTISHAPPGTGSGAGSLSIWVTDVQRVNQSFGLDVVSSTPGTIALTGATVFNPFVDLGIPSVSADRWQGTGNGTTTADAILNFNGVSVTEGFGFNSAVAANDPGHDSAAGAYLYAQIDYDILGVGSNHP